MNEFLSSLKADLLDRRLLPLAGVALTALVAALAYVLLGGGSGASTSSAPTAPVSPTGAGISVSAVETSAAKSVAETTDGVKQQRKGAARNPFTLLPGAPSAANSASTGGSGSSSSSGGSSGGSGGSSGSGESSGKEETKETSKKSSKSATTYHVTVKFGSLAPDPITGEPDLETYVNLKLFTPLPNGKEPLLVFRGVTAGGKAATFTVVGEAILSGTGSCQPSALQCQAVDLKPGEAEKLEYLPPGATTIVSYELRMVSIAKAKAKAKTARAAHVAAAQGWGKSQVGWEVLWKRHLLRIPGMRQSSQAGVLLFGSGDAAHGRHGPRLGR
jgi:hypothetical protein